MAKLRDTFVPYDTFLVGASDIDDGYCVKLSSGALVVAGAGENVLGILHEPSAGKAYAAKDAIVALRGSIVNAVAGDTNIAEMDWVKSDANGKLAKAALNDTENIVGRALGACTADGQKIPIEVCPYNRSKPAA